MRQRRHIHDVYYVHKYFYIRIGTFHHTLRVKQYIQYYLVLVQREEYTDRNSAHALRTSSYVLQRLYY